VWLAPDPPDATPHERVASGVGQDVEVFGIAEDAGGLRVVTVTLHRTADSDP